MRRSRGGWLDRRHGPVHTCLNKRGLDEPLVRIARRVDFRRCPWCGRVCADRHQAAIVYANGGKFDKSFNEGVSNGAKKFSDETKIAVVDFEPANETQFEQAQRRFAQRGQDPIIAVGFSQAEALKRSPRSSPTSTSPSST
jgi:hypothetical protein